MSIQQESAAARRTPAAATTDYWPEIDGLRTIAVLSVFLFHLDHRILPGGFVGVDIFFVISGFVITSSLTRDLRDDRFSIGRFYQRRIARIAPAAMLVIIVTLLASYFVYSDQDYSSAGSNALAAALSVINFKLIFQGSYFTISPDAQPFVHFWSLAVEEQFYVFFPIFLWAAFRWTKLHLQFFIGLFIVSFAACVLLTQYRPTAAFYLLPTRAWELLAGAMIAIVGTYKLNELKQNASILIAAGLLLICVSLVATPVEGFPGWVAFLPICGASLVIAGVTAGANDFATSVLAHPSMVFVGKRSYSLYLWHWPTFSLIDYQLYAVSPTLTLVFKVAISIIATLFTYKFVEKPLRHWLNAPSRRITAFGGFALLSALIVAAGYSIRANYYIAAEPRNVAFGGVTVNPNATPWVVLVGDSQGATYGKMLTETAKLKDFKLNILSTPARNQLPGERDSLWPNVVSFLGERRPDLIIVSQAWSLKVDGLGEDRTADAIATIAKHAKNILIVTQPPIVPASALRDAVRAGSTPPFQEAADSARNRVRVNTTIDQLQNANLQILNVDPTFLLPDGSIQTIAPDGRLAYQDASHLSSSGVAMLAPQFAARIAEALKR